MKNTLTLCALALATSAFAQTSGDRIHKIIPNTSEQFGPGYKNLSTELHVNDIDSIKFDVDAQTFTVFGGYYFINDTIKTATYSLDKLIGFDFTYLADGVMPSTCLDKMEQPDRNAFRLKWRPVDGAAGYQIKYGPLSQMTGDWDNNPDIAGTVTVGPESTDALIEHLDYDTTYQFAIRTLSPKGEGYHSEWSTRTNFRYLLWNNLNILTYSRYVTPNVIDLKGTDLTEATLSLHLDFDPADYSTADADTIRSRFEMNGNRFVFDKIQLTKTLTGEKKDYPVTEADITAGQIKLTGLEEGCLYTVTAYNSNIPWPCDASYNAVVFSTKIDSSTPITVTSPDLGSILSEYMENTAHMPDQKYYLKGGETYTIASSVSIMKGVTLATNPADLAAGKRAKVEFTGNTCFMLGHAKTPGINYADNIHSIIFEGIDFSVPNATNVGSGTALANYFINNYSTGYDYNIEALEIKDCTFQGFIRGFIRQQGYNHNIAKINVDGNVFYNCGYYDKNGNGYAWFNGAGTDTSNMFSDLKFTNNTIYDSPRPSLIYNGSNSYLGWDENTKWNIRIENNTFINFSTRSNGRYLINMRYMPGGSYISVQRNLFVLAADEADSRDLYSSGADIRTSEFSFDVKDNYSVGCRDSHLKDNGIFTGYAFSATKNSFGAYPTANNGTAEDLIVKVGTTPLKATDLFTNPNPTYTAHDPAVPNALDHTAPDNIFEALRYRQTPEVLGHEIYTLGIGDPRWRK